MTGHHDTPPDTEPKNFWEERYSGAGPVWSGRANQVLTEVAAALHPGTALDLGCGEGADAIWLAQRGWRVTGIDISETAIARAASAAQSAGVQPDRIRFVAADLSALGDEDRYDLVTASFLHSPVELPRAEILRRAADLVSPQGHLLMTTHAAPPPWADVDAHNHRFFGPDEELAELALPVGDWENVLLETRARQATGPDGQSATLEDGVVLLRRTSSAA